MSENDWNTFTILRKKYTDKKEKKVLDNNAIREGKFVTKKKTTDAHKHIAYNMKSLDENTEGGKHKKIDKVLCQHIRQGRTAKKITQVQLANLICVKQQVINEYENGTAIPNNQILGNLERKLGICLRGDSKLWGKPLGERFSKKNQNN